jgi:queuine tRNA-ribosyltransferase
VGPRPQFQITARAGAARAGVLRTAHGEVETPAFVPLASTATVKGLDADEVAALGFSMVLGNTFHLFIRPGHERIRRLGGLHEFMGWPHPIITDSGGFQVFSMGHGTVAEEVKRKGGGRESEGRVLSIDEGGVRFRSYLDGRERFMGPETSMEVQAALGTDVALAFDECTPFHATREYTQRSTERTHRWLHRCLEWHERHADPGRMVYGIVQGGVHEDLRRESAEAVAQTAVAGIAIGGTLGRDKKQMAEVVEWAIARLPEERPRHLLGIGDPDDIVRSVAAGIDSFDCATPTRLGRHGTALIADPSARFRLDLAAAAAAESREPIDPECPCPACRRHSRGYLHHLVRSKELTGARLVTLHNLTYMAELLRRIREAIRGQSLDRLEAALAAGAGPYRPIEA